MDKPDNIFNVDERGLNLELRKGKVVISRSLKLVYSQTKGGRDHLTVNCCVSAAAYMPPPFITNEKSYPYGNCAGSSPLGALYEKSPNGYMGEEL